jgi:hypothetical protein
VIRLALWTRPRQRGPLLSVAAHDRIPLPFKQQCATAKRNRRQLPPGWGEMTEAYGRTLARSSRPKVVH